LRPGLACARMGGMPSGALAVRDLTVDLISVRNITVPVVSEVSFQVDPGTIVGLFGESGCGKTTLALALLNLLPARRYREMYRKEGTAQAAISGYRLTLSPRRGRGKGRSTSTHRRTGSTPLCLRK